MSGPKLEPELLCRLDAARPEERIKLVIKLYALEADGAISDRKSAFGQRAEPVAAAVRDVGGELVGAPLWINQTLGARVPAREVVTLANRLARLGTVEALGISSPIKAEAG